MGKPEAAKKASPVAGSINPFYLRADIAAQLKAALAQDPQLPHVALGQFLTREAFDGLTRACAKGWTRVSVPDQHSFSARSRMPVQDELHAFVRAITGKAPLEEHNRRFSHRDFTLMHDEIEEPAGVLGLLFLEDFDPDWGGSVVFTRKGETLARFTPQRNTLLIVRRGKGVKGFVHYVNHKAGKNAVTIISA